MSQWKVEKSKEEQRKAEKKKNREDGQKINFV
jgi:hypothetical protein